VEEIKSKCSLYYNINRPVLLKCGDGNLPMSFALAAMGRLTSVTNFLASRRISMMLLSRAKSGAKGKEATNRVTMPNWMTAGLKNKTDTFKWTL
jgi:hypothetical protein